jgi:hypothetical protein
MQGGDPVGRSKAKDLTQLTTLLSVLNGGSPGLGGLGSLLSLLQNGGLAGPSAEERDVWEGKNRRSKGGGANAALLQNLMGLLGSQSDSSEDDDVEEKKPGWLSLVDRAEAHEKPDKRMMVEAVLELLNERKPDMGRVASRLLLAALNRREGPRAEWPEVPEVSGSEAQPRDIIGIESPPREAPPHVTRGSAYFPRPQGWPLSSPRYIQ